MPTRPRRIATSGLVAVGISDRIAKCAAMSSRNAQGQVGAEVPVGQAGEPSERRWPRGSDRTSPVERTLAHVHPGGLGVVDLARCTRSTLLLVLTGLLVLRPQEGAPDRPRFDTPARRAREMGVEEGLLRHRRAEHTELRHGCTRGARPARRADDGRAQDADADVSSSRQPLPALTVVAAKPSGRRWRRQPQPRGRETATASDSPGSAKGENIRGVEVKVGDPPVHPPLGLRRRPRPPCHRAGRQGDLLGGAQGAPRRRARRRQHQGIRPGERLLAARRRDDRDQGQGTRTDRRIPLVRRLLGRFRRHPETNEVEGPDQARGQGLGRHRQVQGAERTEPDVHTSKSTPASPVPTASNPSE